MKKEIWKDAKGYEKYCQISNFGNIRFKDIVKDKKIYNINGYYHVYFEGNKMKYIHRIVALTFLQNENNYPCVNHKNGIKTDNRVENLEWCTYSYNNKEAYRLGLKKGVKKTKRHKSVVMLDNERKIVKRFYKIKDADKYFNKKISGNIIRSIKTNTRTKGYYWEYAK